MLATINSFKVTLYAQNRHASPTQTILAQSNSGLLGRFRSPSARSNLAGAKNKHLYCGVLEADIGHLEAAAPGT